MFSCCPRYIFNYAVFHAVFEDIQKHAGARFISTPNPNLSTIPKDWASTHLGRASKRRLALLLAHTCAGSLVGSPWASLGLSGASRGLLESSWTSLGVLGPPRAPTGAPEPSSPKVDWLQRSPSNPQRALGPRPPSVSISGRSERTHHASRGMPHMPQSCESEEWRGP